MYLMRFSNWLCECFVDHCLVEKRSTFPLWSALRLKHPLRFDFYLEKGSFDETLSLN